ncbi:MAG: T9SS type A sorting domain-containing protein [Prevotella sp.]|nr:T9SS type A sorting domain-containing protein [Prevotella sp.]
MIADVSKPSLQSLPFKIVTEDNLSTQSYTLKIEKRSNFDDIVVTRWDNTLIINANSNANGDYKFTRYKWFKDNTEIGTRQYYSAGAKKTDVLSGNYYVQLITKDGQVLRTWEKQIALKNSMVMKTYPNPLKAGETIYVQLDTDQELLNNAIIEIYNINGIKVGTTKATSNTTPILIPRSTGIYIIKTKSTGFEREERVIVK